MVAKRISFDNPRAQLVLRNANEPSYERDMIGLYRETSPGKFKLIDVVPTKEHRKRGSELEKELNTRIIASYSMPRRLSGDAMNL